MFVDWRGRNKRDAGGFSAALLVLLTVNIVIARSLVSFGVGAGVGDFVLYFRGNELMGFEAKGKKKRE